MKKAVAVLAVLGVILVLAEAGEAAVREGSRTRGRGARVVGRNQRATTYRSRRSRARRPAPRTVVRHVGVSLPQLRSELSRLETGLEARVKKIETAVAVPPIVPPPVIVAPPPPVEREPTLPLGTAAAGALALAAIAGALGFLWGRQSARAGSEPARDGPGDAADSPWSRFRRQLDDTQRRLSAARARLQNLERRS